MMFDDILFILLLMFLTACPAAVFKWFLTRLHGSCTPWTFLNRLMIFPEVLSHFWKKNTLDSSNGDSLQTWNLQVTHQPLWCVLHLSSLEPTIRKSRKGDLGDWWEKYPKKRKCEVSGTSLGRNVLLIPEIREWPHSLELKVSQQ